MISVKDSKTEFIQVLVESAKHEGLTVSIEQYNDSAALRQTIGPNSRLIYEYSLNFRGQPYSTSIYLSKSKYIHNRDKLLRSAYHKARSECLEYLKKLDREGKL